MLRNSPKFPRSDCFRSVRRYASASDVPPEILARLRALASPVRSDAQSPSSTLGPATTTFFSRTSFYDKSCDQTTPDARPKLPKKNASQGSGEESFVTRNEPTVIFHELDRHGILHVLSGRSQKSALCTSLRLLARDVRKLDGTLKDQLPIILVRDSAILVHIEHIRAIIKYDGVILFENLDVKQRMEQHKFMLFLQTRLQHESMHVEQDAVSPSPFEFIVLEAILQRILQSLQEEFDAMQGEVNEHLKALENIVHWERLKVLLVCRKRVTAFYERLSNIRSCLKELLESDADMADMYLSDKHTAKSADRPAYAHEEMELLLENYLKMAEDLASRTALLMANMQATEDIVNIGLVGQRNELVLLDLRLGIGTFAASVVGCGASILGMNLQSGFERSPLAFYVVLGTLVTMASTSFVLVWRRMLRLIHKK